MSHTLDTTKLNEVFEQLEDNEKLMPWEQNFVESVSSQWKLRGKLSDKQIRNLEGIWLKIP